jgi:hypothetical protein
VEVLCFLPAIAFGAVGIILSVVAKKKNYPRKIEMCEFAYTNYHKILNKIRTCFKRGRF